MKIANQRTLERSVTRKILVMTLGLILPAVLLAGCGPTYSPDTYSGNAVQQANKVDQGVVVGVRAISISADSTLATATGGAAGGIAGSQVGGNAVSALGALGGSVAGGVVGNVVGHATGDTNGFEYIVRKPNGDLLSVTQKDATALKIGQHVLIIEGPQARIVPDYTVAIDANPPKPPDTGTAKPPEAGQPKPPEPSPAKPPETAPANPADTAAAKPKDGAQQDHPDAVTPQSAAPADPSPPQPQAPGSQPAPQAAPAVP